MYLLNKVLICFSVAVDIFDIVLSSALPLITISPALYSMLIVYDFAVLPLAVPPLFAVGIFKADQSGSDDVSFDISTFLRIDATPPVTLFAEI